jgi:hypothetical protein
MKFFKSSKNPPKEKTITAKIREERILTRKRLMSNISREKLTNKEKINTLNKRCFCQL